MILTQQTFSPKKVFFTSDTHFFHGNIISYANRPFADWKEMNDALIRNWNNVVPKDGIVFHLGDFSMGGPDQWESVLQQLKGTIYLVVGNHDFKALRFPAARRFSAVDCEMQINIDGQHLILNHYPLRVYGGFNTKTWQLYGHIHTQSDESCNQPEYRKPFRAPTQYDVGVDNNDYTPVSFEKVKSIIAKQIEEDLNDIKLVSGETALDYLDRRQQQYRSIETKAIYECINRDWTLIDGSIQQVTRELQRRENLQEWKQEL